MTETKTAEASANQSFPQRIMADIQDAYESDDRPWVVGFSGGKDSTALLQITYYALARLPRERRRKPV